MRHLTDPKARGGFSIIELLIAIIIIGILVSVIVPVLLSRSEEARVAAAESDIEHLRGAEERAAIDTSYLYRLYVLDDLTGGDNTFRQFDEGDFDGIDDEDINTAVPLPTKMFIDRKSGNFHSDFANIYRRMSTNETAFGWSGPYINYRRMRDFDYNDVPEDPWGNPYIFFTHVGIVDERYAQIMLETAYSPLDAPNTSLTLRAPFFDRPTILSMGPNGLPGDGSSTNARFGSDDDIWQQF